MDNQMNDCPMTLIPMKERGLLANSTILEESLGRSVGAFLFMDNQTNDCPTTLIIRKKAAYRLTQQFKK